MPTAKSSAKENLDEESEGPKNKKCSSQRFKKVVCSFLDTRPLVLACWDMYAPQLVLSVLEESSKGTSCMLNAESKPVIMTTSIKVGSMGL